MLRCNTWGLSMHLGRASNVMYACTKEQLGLLLVQPRALPPEHVAKVCCLLRMLAVALCAWVEAVALMHAGNADTSHTPDT
eukprot:1161176-Pelagomonas_calceolata.AAC.2